MDLLHPWQVTAWMNRERLTPEEAADRFGVAVGTLHHWRDTCERFSERQARAIAAVMGVVPEMPQEQPVLWCHPPVQRGKPGVLTAEQVVERRNQLGFTIKEFAARLGFSRRYVYDIERGDRRCSERFATVLAVLERKHAEKKAESSV